MAEEGYVVNDMAHLDAVRDVAYGLWDTLDACWLGDENGPRLYTRENTGWANGMPPQLLARISAQLVAVQCGFAPGRIEAREFDGENLRLKDNVQTQMTALEALIKLEGGE